VSESKRALNAKNIKWKKNELEKSTIEGESPVRALWARKIALWVKRVKLV
jgi:hypothetical protein